MARTRADKTEPASRTSKDAPGGQPQLPKQLSHKQGLRLTELDGRELFTVSGVLTPAECTSIVQAAEGTPGGFMVQGSRGPRFGEALRHNGRLAVTDAAFASQLWRTGLQQIFEDMHEPAVGLSEQIRIYRYTPGQHFGKHYDEAVHLPGNRITRFTLLVYLSSAAEGGETNFYNGSGRLVAAVTPQPGLALLHLHGERGLEHEAAAVKLGNKYVLRSDVAYAKA